MSLTCLGLGYDPRIFKEPPSSHPEDEHPILSVIGLIYALLTFLT
jgi:hypothetical protein